MMIVDNTSTISLDEQQSADEEREYIKQIAKQYSERVTPLPVAADDPDVNRLIEAMALFVAKSRTAGKQNVEQLYLRVFRQLLPYLTNPIPSMGLIQAQTRDLAEATQLAHNSVISLSSEDGHQALYRSCSEITLQPIIIERIGQQCTRSGECRIIIDLKACMDTPGKLAQLPLYLNVHKNYLLSLCLKQFLESQLSSVSIMLDDKPYQGQFQFGSPHNKYSESSCETGQIMRYHPLEYQRNYFHFPQLENYLNLYFDDTPDQWQRGQITLEVNAAWPKNIPQSSEMFQLGVIPIENIVEEAAELFTYDGTQSQVPINAPTIADKLALIDVLSVYQHGDAGTKAIPPGILSKDINAYEIHQNSRGYDRIELNLPEAFDSPVKIEVNGRWFQSEFSQHLWKNLMPRIVYFDITGLQWNVFDKIVSHQEPVDFSSQNLLDLSGLKSKAILTFGEVLFILESMGSVFSGEYASIKGILIDLQVEEVLAENSSGGCLADCQGALDYRILVDVLDNNQQQLLLDSFIVHLEAILNSWISQYQINVRYEFSPSAQNNGTV